MNTSEEDEIRQVIKLKGEYQAADRFCFCARKGSFKTGWSKKVLESLAKFNKKSFEKNITLTTEDFKRFSEHKNKLDNEPLIKQIKEAAILSFRMFRNPFGEAGDIYKSNYEVIP